MSNQAENLDYSASKVTAEEPDTQVNQLASGMQRLLTSSNVTIPSGMPY